MRLSTGDHDRDAAGLTYVYPVVSRRARGVSVGVNLNPNNACNWRCVYCQVPGLVAGKGPPIDLARLEDELEGFLARVTSGEWMERHVPPSSRRLNDVAFSGNGEPTSSPDFAAAVDVVARVLRRRRLDAELKVVLITNGSLIHKDEVAAGLQALSALRAELWYKLDRASEKGARAVNSHVLPLERVRGNLRRAAGLVPTWVQTCLFARGGAGPDAAELDRYVEFLRAELAAGTPLAGVLLYGLARASHQPEAAELAPLPVAELEALATRLRTLGLEVRVHP